MQVLSLFDGMSCGQIALKQLNIHVEKYYASEIDKYAISVTQYNFPETIQLGDVTKWREWNVDWSKINLIIGGSPCQGFSFAGNQLAFQHEESKLFFEFVDILNHARKYNQNILILLENVQMKNEWIKIISDYIDESHVTINSDRVSAQNRVRLYWTNIDEIEKPEHTGIILKDILEPDGFVDDATIVNYNGAIPWNSIERKQRTMVGCIQLGEADLNGHESLKRVYSVCGKSPALNTMKGGNREPKVAILQRPRGKNKGGKFFFKAPTLTSNSYEQNNIVEKEGFYRKLTPLECERLQTVPDNYTSKGLNDKGEVVKISDTQRRIMLGNGWTVEVIKHIFSKIDSSLKPKKPKRLKQQTLL